MLSRLPLPATRSTLVSLAVALTFAFVALGAFRGADAAQPLSCGDTITVDTTLESDLLNCPNNGIVIGADDITLDLNAHLIDGDGTPAADCDQMSGVCDGGVVNDGHNGVTVMHGSVREFAVGVLFGTTSGRARDNRVLGVSSGRNQFLGLGIFSQVRGLIRNSSGNGSLDREGNGMALGDSRHVHIVHNTFRRNAHNGINTGQSSHNVIKRNLFVRNDDEGVLVEGGARNQLRRNRFRRNGGGITLGPGSRSVIAHNRISLARDGIRIEKGRGNLVVGNVVVRAFRVGITLGIHEPDVFIGGARNVVRGNLVRRSRVDGFVVVRKDRHSLLFGNIATGARDDGFDVNSRTTRLTRNRAARNADLGIEAVRGVIDGGGNRASANGDARQCVNVTCH